MYVPLLQPVRIDLSRPEASEQFGISVNIIRMSDVLEAQRKQIFPRVARDLAEAVIHIQEAAGHINLGDADGSLAIRCAQPLSTLPQLSFGPLARGDVLDYAFESKQISRVLSERPRAQREPDDAPVLAIGSCFEVVHGPRFLKDAPELGPPLRIDMYLMGYVRHGLDEFLSGFVAQDSC